MKQILDFISVLGFFLTALGTYLTIKSGEGEVVIKDESLKYGSILLILALFTAFHYFRKYEIAKSVIEGRTELHNAYQLASQLSDSIKSKGNIRLDTCINEFSKVCVIGNFASSEIGSVKSPYWE